MTAKPGTSARLPSSTFFILLVAFAVRVWSLESVRYDYDFSYPPGLGIVIAQSIADGRWGDLPVLSLRSGIMLPNPVGASYLWALVSLVDRSPYDALALSAMLSVCAVAMVYAMARRMFGERVAFFAAAFMACSPWAVYVARGTWLQGLLEFSVVASAWLVLVALRDARPRRLLAGLVCAALAAQTYLVAFGLILQVAVACVIGRAWRPRLRRAARAGLILCAASALVYMGCIVAGRINLAARLETGVNNRSAISETERNSPRAGLSALLFAARYVDGRDFEQAMMSYTDPPDACLVVCALRDRPVSAIMSYTDPPSPLRAVAIDAFLAAGIMIAVLKGWRCASHRLILGWFAAPIVSVVVLSFIFPGLAMSYQYMLLTSPAGYILAALPMAGLMDVLTRTVIRNRRGAALARTGLAVVVMVVPITSLFAMYDSTLEHPYISSVNTLPLRDQMQIGRLWRERCAEVSTHYDAFENRGIDWRYWAASLLSDARLVRVESVSVVDQADAWEARGDGGSCVTRVGHPIPASFADAYDQVLADGTRVTTYRSRAIAPAPGAVTLTVNLGWTLIGMEFPSVIRPGEWVTVTQTWRVDALPSEPYAHWRYDPFIQLIGPAGVVVATSDGPSLPGASWHAGDAILSNVRFQVPAELAEGDYQLRASLYDREQKKNAVYFRPDGDDEPLLGVERAVRVR